MSRFIPIILGAGFISFIVTPLIRQLAQRVNFVDNPQARKVHVTPMPMLGGLAIYLGLVIALLFGVRTLIYSELVGIMSGATIMVLVGLWDDRMGLAPLPKLIGEVLAALALLAAGVQVHVVSAEAINVLLTILWVIGICNAINFQDNMDGLAAGLSTVASGFFFMVAVIEGLGVVSTLAAATLGASVGFLYYNFNPASLFMGDAGSLLLGFVLAVLGIKLEFAGRPLGATWMIPIIILGVPIFDMTLVVISRLRRGKHVYEGGKDHTSHRLVTIVGMTHARSVMTLYLIAVVLGLTAVMLRDATLLQARLLLVGLVVAFVSGLAWLEINFDSTEQSRSNTPSPPD